MKMAWWTDPFEEIRRLRREIDRIFDALASMPELSAKLEWREPLVDMKETEDSVIIEVELPGLNKEDIQLKATDDSLEIKGESKKIVEEAKEGFIRKERSYRGFYRRISLPIKVKPEEAKAKYENGILRVELPKAEPKKGKFKEIKIE